MNSLLILRQQCEELRSALSKQNFEQVCLDRLDQLQQKEEAALEKQAYDDMYAKLWEQDMLEKAAREEREAKDQHERNRGVLEIQRKQMAALEAKKEEERKLKEEEAHLMVIEKYIFVFVSVWGGTVWCNLYVLFIFLCLFRPP